MKISTIIFSKDRAMQLDAVLRSFYLHCLDAEHCKINVIFQASTPQYQQQYKHLISAFSTPNVEFIKENHFRSDLLDVMQKDLLKDQPDWRRKWVAFSSKIFELTKLPIPLILPKTDKYILFLVDDNIFVRDFYLGECIKTLENHPEALGYSLRLGTNTTYCYPLHHDQVLPEFTTLINGSLLFSWIDADKDFNYPLEVSSSIYRLSEIAGFINRLPFKNPNQLEGEMAARSHFFTKKQPNLLCSKQSITFCNPINIVQTVFANISGKSMNYSSQNLADLFDQGQRINIDAFTNFIPNGCHQEVELSFMDRV